MSMMRRGPLDRYPVEWVLRQASAHEITGSLEFHAEVSATFHLHGGRVYAADPGVGDTASPASSPTDELEARKEVVQLLADVLDARDGWYYLDPLGHAPGRGAWAWETASLLMETRARAHEDRTLSAWRERTVMLRPAPHAEVVLSADAWQVVVSLAGTATTSQIVDRLGWNPGRMLAALDDLERAAILDPDVGTAIGSAPAATAALPDAAPNRHAGPLAPPPPISAAALSGPPSPGERGGRGGLRRRRAQR